LIVSAGKRKFLLKKNYRTVNKRLISHPRPEKNTAFNRDRVKIEQPHPKSDSPPF
jgi:hypothetical protein